MQPSVISCGNATSLEREAKSRTNKTSHNLFTAYAVPERQKRSETLSHCSLVRFALLCVSSSRQDSFIRHRRQSLGEHRSLHNAQIKIIDFVGRDDLITPLSGYPEDNITGAKRPKIPNSAFRIFIYTSSTVFDGSPSPQGEARILALRQI